MLRWGVAGVLVRLGVDTMPLASILPRLLLRQSGYALTPHTRPTLALPRPRTGQPLVSTRARARLSCATLPQPSKTAEKVKSAVM